MKTALITGVTGQDGSYMVELLISKGYRVIGTTRNLPGANSKKIANLKGQVVLVECCMKSQNELINILEEYRPLEVYNFAAFSTGIGMYDEPAEQSFINGNSPLLLLEAINSVNPKIKFCQASSSEMFGETTESPQTEKTPFYPQSPYGVAKLFAHFMIGIYRKKFGLFCCSAIMFNHESPRRSLDFVTRKISYNAAKIKLGLTNEIQLGNMDVCRDWGYAADYVYAMWLMLQNRFPDDYIVSTNKPHSVKEFCEGAFNLLDLDYRDYLKSSHMDHREGEKIRLVGNNAKISSKLGWRPTIDFQSLIKLMVTSDLNKLSKEL